LPILEIMRSVRFALLLGAAALLAAIYPWPYDYYVFLRFLVCGICIFAAYVSLREHSALAFPFLAVGILFNPLVPAHMTRAIWIGVDLVVATGFLVTVRLAPRLDAARSVRFST
jgi:hypothetical protein